MEALRQYNVVDFKELQHWAKKNRQWKTELLSIIAANLNET